MDLSLRILDRVGHNLEGNSGEVLHLNSGVPHSSNGDNHQELRLCNMASPSTINQVNSNNQDMVTRGSTNNTPLIVRHNINPAFAVGHTPSGSL